jgi:hypothetical protein
VKERDTIQPAFYVRGELPADISGATGEPPSDEKGFRAMTPAVGRTHHDANHDLVVAGDPLPVGRWFAAGARSGGGAGALKALGDPDLDD